VCIALCTAVAHNIAQNKPDDFPSYPPDNHHCCDDVYLREGGVYPVLEQARNMLACIPSGVIITVDLIHFVGCQVLTFWKCASEMEYVAKKQTVTVFVYLY